MMLERIHSALEMHRSNHTSMAFHRHRRMSTDVVRLSAGYYQKRQQSGILSTEDVSWSLRELQYLTQQWNHHPSTVVVTCVMLATKVVQHSMLMCTVHEYVQHPMTHGSTVTCV